MNAIKSNRRLVSDIRFVLSRRDHVGIKKTVPQLACDLLQEAADRIERLEQLLVNCTKPVVNKSLIGV